MIYFLPYAFQKAPASSNGGDDVIKKTEDLTDDVMKPNNVVYN